VLKHDLVGVFRRWYPRLHAHTRWTGGVIRGRRRGGGWPQPIRVHLPTGLITYELTLIVTGEGVKSRERTFALTLRSTGRMEFERLR
jgi:hypothetical protein